MLKVCLNFKVVFTHKRGSPVKEKNMIMVSKMVEFDSVMIFKYTACDSLLENTVELKINTTPGVILGQKPNISMCKK